VLVGAAAVYIMQSRPQGFSSRLKTHTVGFLHNMVRYTVLVLAHVIHSNLLARLPHIMK
jgi:tRNA U38,U39,U40 pseudouridine synthase TruA